MDRVTPPEKIPIDSADLADAGDSRCEVGRGEGGNAPLELVLVVPVLVLLVIFVLWAGRGGRAGLVTDLAAGEAAAVAALYSDDPTDAAAREQVVEQVLSARPGLDFLCIGGARGRDHEVGTPDVGFVDEEWVTFEPEVPGASPGVGVIGVSLECVTDGAVAPTRHLLPTVSFSGRATEVVALDPRPQLSVAAASHVEGSNAGATPDMNVLTFQFALDAPATQDVTINYWTRPDPNAVLNGLARLIDDYTPVAQGSPGTAMIMRGQSSATAEIAIKAENLYELDETLELVWEFVPSAPCAANVPRLGAGVNRLSTVATLHPSNHASTPCQPTDPLYWQARSVGTIVNDDPRPTLSVTSPSAVEGPGSIDFEVSLDVATAVPVTFRYMTTDGTAKAGSDYGALSTTATINANETAPPTVTVSVPVINDYIAEPDETFYLDITDVDTHATATDPLRGTATITDDEPTIRIVGAKATEGVALGFDVTAAGITTGGGQVTVDYNVTDGTATSGTTYPDYTAVPPATLTFTTSGTQTITVNTLHDSIDEADETFTVALANPSSNARIVGDTSVIGTIEDNDPTPKLTTAATATVAEGKTVDLDFGLSNKSSDVVQFWFDTGPTASTTDYDAKKDTDYRVITTSPKSISALSTGPAKVEIEAKTDSIVDDNETFELNVNSILNADPDPDPLTVTVTITDTPPREFTVDDPTAREGDPLTFTISLADAVTDHIAAAVTVNYTISVPNTGNPAEPEDYDHTRTGGSVTFDPGEATKTVVVDTKFDLEFEGDETLLLTIDTKRLPDGFASSKAKGTGTIEDVLPPVLSVGDASAVEGGPLDFVLTLDRAAVLTTNFKVCTHAQRATSGVDYDDQIEHPTCAPRTIAKGGDEITVSVATFTDGILDDNENLQLIIRDLDNALLSLTDAVGVGTIKDDTGTLVRVNDAKALEGDEVGFLVSLNVAAPVETTVDYMTTQQTADAGPFGSGDYEATYESTVGTVTFAQGEFEKTVKIKTWSDTQTEGAEQFQIGLSNPTPNDVGISDPTGTGTINEPGTFLTIAGDRDVEGQPLDFVVTRTGSLEAETTVKYTTADFAGGGFTSGGTAIGGIPPCAPCDYHTRSGTLRFAPGEDKKTVTVQTAPDAGNVTEVGERFRVDLSDPKNATLLKPSAIGTINRPCVHPSRRGTAPPTITGIDATISESSIAHVWRFSMNPALCSSGQLVVSQSGTATLGSDFVEGQEHPGLVNGPSISMPRTILLHDELDEDDETVVIVVERWDNFGWDRFPSYELFRDQHLGMSPQRLAIATLTIVDDDDPPSVSVRDARAQENQTMRFSVRLDSPSGKTVRIPYATRNRSSGSGRAFAGSDYRAASGTLVFDPGDIEEFIEVEALPDGITESEETFLVALGTPEDGNANLGVSQAEGTIVDDALPALSIVSNYESNGTQAQEGGSETFTVSLSRASTQTVTVQYATREMTAEADSGSDYTRTFGTLTFTYPQRSQTFTVPITVDSAAENDERFQAELSNPRNAVLGDSIAETTIAAQCVDVSNRAHSPPAVTLEDAQASEGSQARFNLFLDRPFCSTQWEVRMDFDLRHITTDDDDFTSSPATIDNQYVLFYNRIYPHESRPPVVNFQTDFLDEPDEMFEVSVRWLSARNYPNHAVPLSTRYLRAAPVTAVGTILNVDRRKTVVSVGDASGPEGTTLSFPVLIDRPFRASFLSSEPARVHYEVTRASSSQNAATPGVDFQPDTGTLTIPHDEVAAVIHVTTLRDELREPDEELLVRISNPSPSEFVEIGDANARGTILDASDPRLSVSDASADEGQVLEFEVTLDQASEQAVSAQYRTVAGTAVEGDDYLQASGVLEFAAGETSKTVTVAALTDNRPLEGDETFRLMFSNAVGADLSDPAGLGTIRNLGVPTISVADARAPEGSSVLFSVTLSNPANRDITVSYETVTSTVSGDVSAVPREDYTPGSGTVTITAGNTSAVVAVAALEDRIDEYNEVFTLVLSAPTYGAFADPRATATISDNDPEPRLIVDDVYTAEDNSTMPVVVRLDTVSGRSVTVDYTLTDDSAAAAADYVDSEGTLTIPAGRLSTTLDVELIDDNDDEGAERFTIELTNPLNASLTGAGTASLTIIDDEGLPTVYAESSAGSIEGDDAQITLRLSRESPDRVTLQYSTGGGNATPVSDYTAVTPQTAAFAPRRTTYTLSTETNDDTEVEDSEHFNWLLSGASGAQLAQTSVPSWILDNDGEPELTVDDAVVAEGSSARFTVRLSSPAAAAVTVDYRSEADPFAASAAAVPGQDFEAVSGTARIDAGDLSTTVEVAVPDDALNEGTETFWLRLDADSATGAEVRDAVAVGAITDDDPSPALSIHDASAVEGDPVRFEVRLDSPSGRVVRAEYVATTQSTADPDNRATPVRDFDAVPRSLLIPAGVTSVIAEVDTVIDRIAEHQERFLVRVFNATHAVVTDSRAVGTIIDQNELPRAFIADTEAVEGDASAQFTVTLSHPSTTEITFLYSTTDGGTASDTDDYVAITDRTLTVPANNTSVTFTVALRDDTATEFDETFTVELRNPRGATLIDSEATATIIDDDGLPRFTVADNRADEADASMEFTVTLSHRSVESTSVRYATFDNTASQPDDYSPASGTLTFAPGVTTRSITVPIKDDPLDEFDETLLVRLSSPVRAIVRPTEAAATGTIVDDDDEPSLSVSNSFADEGEQLNFTAFLNAPSGRTVSATYNTVHDDDSAYPATAGEDYVSSSGLLTFSPGEVTKTIPVTTRLDANTEAPETLLLALSNTRYASLVAGRPHATGTIRNRELPAITIADSSALEGDPIAFTISLDRPSDTDVIVTYTVQRGSADPYPSNPFDYYPPATNPATTTIPAGHTVATVTIPTNADNTIESDEIFFVGLTAVSGNAQIQDAGAIGTILENALAPTLSVADAQTPEGAPATFTVTLTRHATTASTPVSIGYRTNALTAGEGTDYSAQTGTLNFPAGTTTQQLTVTVPTVPDELPESAETFQLILHTPQGDPAIEDATAVATILDDDGEPNLSINSGETDEGKPLVFTATLDAPSGREITADYRTGSLTATDGVDYLSAVGTLVFPVGATSQNITVATLPDSLVEPDETFEVTLTESDGAIRGAGGTGTIIDATEPGIRVAEAAAEEGDSLEFTISLNRQSTDTIEVDYATSDGSATLADSDYTQNAGTATFPPGVTQQTVLVATSRDDRDEPDEALTLTLSNESDGTKILVGSATGTIHNSAVVTVSVEDTRVVEQPWATNTMVFTLRLNRPSNQVVRVDYATVDGTATGHTALYFSGHTDYQGEDYISTSGTAQFLPGQLAQEVEVVVGHDFVDEMAETLQLRLSNAVNAVLDPERRTATGTIVDGDPTPTILASAQTLQDGVYKGSTGLVGEGEGPIRIWVEFFHRYISDRDVTVHWKLVGSGDTDLPGTATAGQDYVAAMGTLAIPALKYKSEVVEVQIIDDSVYEGDEDFYIILSNPVNALLADPNVFSGGTGIGFTIVDNEPHLFGLSGGAAVEGGDVEFTVHRYAPYDAPLTGITYRLTDDTASHGTDYGGTTTGNISFSANQSRAFVSIPTSTDTEPEVSERFDFTISTPSGVGLTGPDTVTGIILDSDQRVVSISGNYTGTGSPGTTNYRYATTQEGAAAVLNVSLNAPSNADVVVDYSIVGGTATGTPYLWVRADYLASSHTGHSDWPSGSVTILQGQTEVQLRLWTLYDRKYEDTTETVQVAISNPKGAVLGQTTAEMRLLDGDEPPNITVHNAVTEEGEPAVFRVDLDRVSDFTTTVDYRTADLTGRAGEHYTASADTVTVLPGSRSATFSVPTANDDELLGERTFSVELSNPKKGLLLNSSAIGRITNDDCVDLARSDSPPLLRMASSSADEGDNMSFTVSLDKPFCKDVTEAVTLSTSLGTAGSGDVTTPTAVLGFKAGESQVTYSGVVTIEDSIDEPDETITATASWHSSMPAAYNATVSAAGTINDDDDEPGLRIVDASNTEARSLIFIVRLDAASGKQVTVNYATNTAGTARSGTDYTAVSNTLTFAPGERTKQIVVQSTGDSLNETDEIFQVVLSGAVNAQTEDSIGRGTIENDDPLPVLSIADVSADEDDSLRFTISLDTASGRNVTVLYTTADGTAVAGSDYTAATSTATIIAGQTTTTIEISTTADTVVEPDETFTVQLLAQHPTDDLRTVNATISATAHTATGTIANDDT